MASKNSVHLATLVTNIKNCIPITLNEDAHQYNTWSTIFHLHCRAHLLLDHIVFDDKNPSSTNVSWQRFDDIMRTWIYVNIFVELIKSILSPTDKAIDTWNRLVNRFQNHKTTRVLTLESQFNSIHLSRFFLVKSYCSEIKNIADALYNLGSSDSDSRLSYKFSLGLPKTIVLFGPLFNI